MMYIVVTSMIDISWLLLKRTWIYTLALNSINSSSALVQILAICRMFFKRPWTYSLLAIKSNTNIDGFVISHLSGPLFDPQFLRGMHGRRSACSDDGPRFWKDYQACELVQQDRDANWSLNDTGVKTGYKVKSIGFIQVEQVMYKVGPLMYIEVQHMAN